MKNEREGKAVKAAMKNMSVSISDVTNEQFESIMENTKVQMTSLSSFTNDDAFERFQVSYRTGSKIKNKHGFELEKFDTSNQVVNILSDRYSLIQNDELFNNIFTVLNDNGVKYSISKVYVDQRPGSNKIYSVLTLDDIKINVDGSNISPSIDVFNSTDGTLAAGILLGAYRFKCGNGMLLGESYGLEKVIHSASAISRLNFEKMFASAMHEFDELRISIEKMQEIKMTSALWESLKRAGGNSMFIKHYDSILNKYMIDYTEEVPKDTLWGLYATYTNFISNHVIKKSIREAIAQQRMLNNFRNSLVSQ